MKQWPSGWTVGIVLLITSSLLIPLTGCSNTPTRPAEHIIQMKVEEIKPAEPKPMDWPIASIIHNIDGNHYIAFTHQQAQQLEIARTLATYNYEAARLNRELVAALVKEREELVNLLRYVEEELASSRGPLFPKTHMIYPSIILLLLAGIIL